MSAVRITFNTDKIDPWGTPPEQLDEQAKNMRRTLARVLPQVAEKLALGDYVGNFHVIDPETGIILSGDVDEL